MKKLLFPLSVAIVVALLALSVAAPAQAITFGQPDGGLHPNVGALGYWWTDGQPYIDCSGTLIAPDVFLTAAHCVAWLPSYALDAGDLWVSFDTAPESGNATLLPVRSYAYDPQYGHDAANLHDVAVVLLAAPVTGIRPASLPTAGLLDQMKAAKTLKNQVFVAVGYGTVRDDKTGGPHPLFWEGIRRYVEQTYNSLTKYELHLSMNPSTGDGGSCYGDSGGPHFLGWTDTVVSITITGDANCRATDVTYRTDTDTVRAFLGQFVTLP